MNNATYTEDGRKFTLHQDGDLWLVCIAELTEEHMNMFGYICEETMQKFIAREKFQFSNGAIGWRPGGPMDCLGPYAKVQNCPVEGTDLRLTCYATGYADTYFSVPACTRRKGKYIGGFFTMDDGNVLFRPYDRFKHLL